MGEVVNLRQARKAKRRRAAEQTAQSNRATHGRTKAEAAADRAGAEKLDRRLDGARRDVD